MSAKIKKQTSSKQSARFATDSVVNFIRYILPQILGWLVLLITVSFFTGTYDSAYVKLTLLQIGSILLLTLWTALKITEHKNPFTRKNLLFLAPLLIYIAWQTWAWLCFPYKLETAEEWVRLLFYGGISTLIACEFTTRDIQTVTRFIVASAWISFTYGTLQIINIWLPGADLLPWRGFFAHRVFSTLANPNFFGAFIVFVSAIIGAEFLRTHYKRLIILLGLGMLNLIFTESKGAWLAYAGMAVFFAFAYTNCLASIKKHLLKINLTALCVLLVACVAAGIYSTKRFQSVSFRTYTWISAFEMVKDSPILGTGPGSFKLVYPAYRRPQIFYIENAHNNETQHAENEYLEQAATGGLIGLALFLWLCTFLCVGSFKNMRLALPQKLSSQEHTRLTTRRWLLLGYVSALVGLLLHAGVDISIHFASSGILFATCIGLLLALFLDNPPAQPVPLVAPTYPRILVLLRRIVGLTALGTAGYITYAFYLILRNMAVTSVGEGLLWTIAWVTAAGCILGILYVYAKIVHKTTHLAVCGLLLVSLPLCLFAFRLFAANHYYSLGVALVQLGQPAASLGAFSDAIRLNPFLSEYRQYRASVFAMTLNLSKRFMPSFGDTDMPRTDYERAQADFEFVQTHNPLHALLNQNQGQLHYTLAMRHLTQTQETSSQAELLRSLATENFQLAQHYFERALQLDPVNPNTYVLLANIEILQHHLDKAQQWLDTYYKGPAGVTEPEFLERHTQNPQINAVQTHLNQLKAVVPQI